MITVVSGLPRSGTSLLMQMLHAGGFPILCDQQRQPDPDNPSGYFEYAPVRGLERDASWMPNAEGQAVKIVSPLLKSLPTGHSYNIIFMRRNLDEVLASQERMLARRGQPAGPDRTLMRTHFERHLQQVTSWLATQSQIRVLELEYAQVVTNPTTAAEAITSFLNTPLNIPAMIAAVDPALYRNRTP